MNDRRNLFVTKNSIPEGALLLTSDCEDIISGFWIPIQTDGDIQMSLKMVTESGVMGIGRTMVASNISSTTLSNSYPYSLDSSKNIFCKTELTDNNKYCYVYIVAPVKGSSGTRSILCNVYGRLLALSYSSSGNIYVNTNFSSKETFYIYVPSDLIMAAGCPFVKIQGYSNPTDWPVYYTTP